MGGGGGVYFKHLHVPAERRRVLLTDGQQKRESESNEFHDGGLERERKEETKHVTRAVLQGKEF